MMRSEADLTIAAATLSDPLRARAATAQLLRDANSELERIEAALCHCLRYAGERDGKVPAPMLRALMFGGA